MSQPNSGKNGGSSSGKNNRSRNNRGRNRQNRQNRPRRYGSTAKKTLEERNAAIIKDMETQARVRFDQNPPPMGFPEDLEQPKTFKFEWKLSPVPLKDEEAMAGKVMRKGEFGWLEDDRVDEIADIAKGYKMTLEQALSLRSALLQQKTVYGHGRQGLRKVYVNQVDLANVKGPSLKLLKQRTVFRMWIKANLKNAQICSKISLLIGLKNRAFGFDVSQRW